MLDLVCIHFYQEYIIKQYYRRKQWKKVVKSNKNVKNKILWSVLKIRWDYSPTALPFPLPVSENKVFNADNTNWSILIFYCVATCMLCCNIHSRPFIFQSGQWFSQSLSHSWRYDFTLHNAQYTSNCYAFTTIQIFCSSPMHIYVYSINVCTLYRYICKFVIHVLCMCMCSKPQMHVPSAKHVYACF